MVSLQSIKTRISSVESTKKITKAMQLVASAKLKSTQSNLKNIQEYYSSVKSIFENMLNKITDVESIFPKPNTEDVLWIIITSDMGLCGAYNSNIFRIINEEIKSNDKLIVVGARGLSSLNKYSDQIIQTHINIGDNPSFNIVSQISDEAISSYMTGLYKEVKLVYTKFVNSFTQTATITNLLPLEKPTNEVEENMDADFEPSVEVVIKNSLPLYFNAMLYGTMLESKVSEMSARRVAMENATDNAEELIDDLKVKYNSARQATITQEINEIVAGSE